MTFDEMTEDFNNYIPELKILKVIYCQILKVLTLNYLAVYELNIL